MEEKLVAMMHRVAMTRMKMVWFIPETRGVTLLIRKSEMPTFSSVRAPLMTRTAALKIRALQGTPRAAASL